MKKFLLALAVFAPSLAFAQTGAGAVTNTFQNLNVAAQGATGFVGTLTTTVNAGIPLLLAVAVIVFIWSVIRFLTAKGGFQKEKAREYLIWSVIAIAVILAIFGLAKFLLGFFGITPGNGGLTGSDIPTVPVNGR